jgi:hypothetical protein
MCILRDLPQQKNCRALCQGRSHVYVFPCSHGNISFVPIKKEARREEIKRELFLYSCVLLRFWNTIGLTPSSATPSGERSCTPLQRFSWHFTRSWWTNGLGGEREGPRANVQCLFSVLALTLSTWTCATWRFNYYSWSRTWDHRWHELGSLFCIVFGASRAWLTILYSIWSIVQI